MLKVASEISSAWLRNSVQVWHYFLGQISAQDVVCGNENHVTCRTESGLGRLVRGATRFQQHMILVICHLQVERPG